MVVRFKARANIRYFHSFLEIMILDSKMVKRDLTWGIAGLLAQYPPKRAPNGLN